MKFANATNLDRKSGGSGAGDLRLMPVLSASDLDRSDSIPSRRSRSSRFTGSRSTCSIRSASYQPRRVRN